MDYEPYSELSPIKPNKPVLDCLTGILHLDYDALKDFTMPKTGKENIMIVKDNTKLRFDELEGGDIFTCKVRGEDELCLKLDNPVILKDNTLEANAVLLLTGEPVNIIDGKCSIRHNNVTLELN